MSKRLNAFKKFRSAKNVDDKRIKSNKNDKNNKYKRRRHNELKNQSNKKGNLSKLLNKNNNNKSLKILNKNVQIRNKKKEFMSLQRSMDQKKLILTCERGDISSLKLIINKYQKNKLKILKSLIEYEDINNNSRTPLIYCCINGAVECLLELLRNNVNLEHFVEGSTPLYHATSRGNIECVEELLIYGANVNSLNHKGWTSLMNASYFGHYKIVQLLLKYGSNPDIIRDNYDGKSALHFAAKNGRYKVVELLLKYGANPNLFDNNENMTCLMYAVKNGYYQIVQLLILYGANPYLKNKDAKCAIDFIQQHTDNNISPNNQNQNNNNQDELFTFVQSSARVYNGINKLIIPDKMRKIIKYLKKIEYIYPHILEELKSVSHMKELGQSELDIHRFNNVICTQLQITASNNSDNKNNDNDNDIEEDVLNSFRDDIISCKSSFNELSSTLLLTRQQLKQIESDIIGTTKGENELMAQISLLQRQLKLCQQRQIQLKNKQIIQKNTINNLNISLNDIKNELNMKNKIYLLMDEACRNIKNLELKANSIPLKYRRELQFEYKKKRKILENQWNLWNLNDVITWICSLDPSGRFYKYKDNLTKLKQLDDKSHKKRSKRNKKRKRKRNKNNKKQIININNDISSSQYDGDEGKSDDDDNDIQAQVANNANINSDIEIEGQNDYGDDTDSDSDDDVDDVDDVDDDIMNVGDIIISDADFDGNDIKVGDDDDDNDKVAIPDPSNVNNDDDKDNDDKHKDNNDKNDNIVDMSSLIANEGQYHIHYSDSDDSNNDNHQAKEVIISALMPDDDDDDDDDILFKNNIDIDVDNILDGIGDDLFDNLSNRDTDDDDSDDYHDNDNNNALFNKNNNKFINHSYQSNVINSDESCSAPDEPILESINNTVLKMCGIRDSKDRKIIMYHIETLINQSNNTTILAEPDPLQNDNDNDNDEKHILLNDNNDIDKKQNKDNKKDDDDDDEIPSEFICPITKDIMKDPVILSDGHSYERFAIEDWLLKHDKSPMTNQKLLTKQVFPNHGLRSMIQEYKMQKSQKL